MSRKKHNAGKGYGMMFHGAFASKADAKKKERQVHGFIQPRNIKGERRYVVMSERKNPRKRKAKRTPEMVEAYAPRHESNPMELTVMGANPREREITVHPGEKIVLKVNPSAEAIREEFVGRPAALISIFHEPHMEKGDYAKLGDLMGITYKPIGGGQVEGIGWYQRAETIPLHEAAKKLLPLTDAPVLVASKSKRLYLVGGNQDYSPMLAHVNVRHPNAEDYWDLGEARTIVYRERKHFDDFELINYQHRFGEENGKCPLLVYDRRNNRLLIEGGDYDIRPEGITN